MYSFFCTIRIPITIDLNFVFEFGLFLTMRLNAKFIVRTKPPLFQLRLIFVLTPSHQHRFSLDLLL